MKNKIKKFLEFEGNVEDYLNETVTSANFVIGNVVPPEDEDEDLDVNSGEQEFTKDKQYKEDDKIVDYSLITAPEEEQEEKCKDKKEEKIVDYSALDKKVEPVSEESIFSQIKDKKRFNLNEFVD